jgi:hypothetical protein
LPTLICCSIDDMYHRSCATRCWCSKPCDQSAPWHVHTPCDMRANTLCGAYCATAQYCRPSTKHCASKPLTGRGAGAGWKLHSWIATGATMLLSLLHQGRQTTAQRQSNLTVGMV